MRYYALALVVVLVGMVGVFMPPLAGLAQDVGPSVDKVRIGQDGKRSRLVFELSSNVEYRWFTLPKPARLVVDFPAIHFSSDINNLPLPPASSVKAMRAGQFRPGIIRLVMDLEKPSKVSVFTIPATQQRGPRLVVDVMPPKAGEAPTDVAPPSDVVTQTPWKIPTPGDSSAANPEICKTDLSGQDVVRKIEKKVKGRPLVVLDPGHGGVDPGACGRYAPCEKNIVLDVGRRVREILQQEGIQVLMTRDTDVFIPLGDRPKMAQKAGADLFVSLHADMHPTNSSVRGATVYMVSDKASDREAARLADSENAGDQMAGIALNGESAEVRNILVSLVQRDTLNNSAYLGQALLGQLGKATPVRKDSLLFAGFKVIKSPDIPSVLVEMGYLSNPSEARQLGSASYRDRVAHAVAEGIRAYIASHVHD